MYVAFHSNSQTTQQCKHHSGVSEWVSVWIESSNRSMCRYKLNETSPNKHQELCTNISFNLTSFSHFEALYHTFTCDIHHTRTASVQCADTPIVLSIYLRGLFAMIRKYTCFVDNDRACFNFVIHLKCLQSQCHYYAILILLFGCQTPNISKLNSDTVNIVVFAHIKYFQSVTIHLESNCIIMWL